MYKVTYIDPGSRQEIALGEKPTLEEAKVLARANVVTWVMLMFQSDEIKAAGIESNVEVWRPFAEDTVKIAWVEEDGVIYGEGYNGGSIVLPPQRFIRIEAVQS